MRFEEALRNFQNALIMELGDEDALLQVTLSHKAFDSVMIDMCKRHHFIGQISFSPSGMSDCNINGVAIRARDKSSL